MNFSTTEEKDVYNLHIFQYFERKKCLKSAESIEGKFFLHFRPPVLTHTILVSFPASIKKGVGGGNKGDVYATSSFVKVEMKEEKKT